MTRRQQLVLLSVPSIQSCLERHRACYRPIAGLVDQVTMFERLAARAVSLKQRADESDPEEEVPLDADTEALIEAVRIASGPLEGWTAIIGDETLRCQVGSTKSELRAMGPGLTGHARVIWEIGSRSLDRGAGHYGLTSKMLSRLEETIAVCDQADILPESANRALCGAVDRLSFFLRDIMDPLMRGFLRSAPEFYVEYVEARKGPSAVRALRGGLRRRTSTAEVTEDAALSS